jgi:magnesium transporter
MKTNCYQLSEGAFITAVDWPGWDSIQQDKNLKHPYWLVIDDINNAEMAENLKSLNLHPLIMEDCLSPDHSTLVDRYSDAIYIEFPTNAGHKYGEVAYLSIICFADLIISIIRGEVESLPDFINFLQEDNELTTGNTANLLYLLIDYFTEKTITQSLVYRQRLNLLEKKLIRDPDDVDPNDITDLKRQLTQLEFICEDQLYCAKSLIIHDDTVINTAGQEAYFNDLISDAEHGLRAITRLNGRVKDLQDDFTLLHHESSEKRLRILTIISAIFLPLTFITGFFGMNFIDMRLLNVHFGSLIAVGIMVIISLSLLGYFKTRGWFD